RAADGEGGDDDLPAALDPAHYDLAKLVLGVDHALLHAGAVGAFADHHVSGRQGGGVAQNRLVDAADVAGEVERGGGAVAVSERQPHAGRAEHVPGLDVAGEQSGHDLEPAVVGDALDLLDGVL